MASNEHIDIVIFGSEDFRDISLNSSCLRRVDRMEDHFGPLRIVSQIPVNAELRALRIAERLIS